MRSRIPILLMISSSVLFADFSYDQTTRVTGGALAGAMKMAAVFSKQAREPMRTTVAVKGDRMVHWSPLHASIIDLGKETITTIDFQKKTWSVQTFAEMQQMMEQMSERMKEKRREDPNSADVKFKVAVDPTGQTKDISGLTAKEMLVKMEMEATDTQSGQSGTMVMTMDTWIAPRVPGYEEITEFYKRMLTKIGWMPGQMPMARSDLSKGMAEMTKQLSKMDGMPVYTTSRMGGQGMQAQAPPPGSQPADQGKKGPSAGSVLGNALGGRFGRSRQSQDQQTSDSNSGAQPGGQPNSGGLLMEMVTESGNFSAAPIDPAKFDVPAGFKQVDPRKAESGR